MMKLGLWVVVLTLAALIYLQWRDWPPPPDWQMGSGEAEARTSTPAFDLAPDLLTRLDARDGKGAYSEVIERPLFQPDRRPPEDEGQTAREVEEEGSEERALAGLDLSAVIMTPDMTTAWVFDVPNRTLLKVRVGDNLVGWEVRAIRDDRLLLERQGETDTLLLRSYAAANASPRAGAETRRPRPALARPSTSPNRQQRSNARRRPQAEP